MKKSFKLFFSLFLIISVKNSFAVAINAIANGNWNSTLTWSTGTIPGTVDSVIIPTSITVNMNVNGTCLNLLINSSGTLNFNTNAVTLTVGGNATLNGNITGAGTTRTLNVSGNLIAGNSSIAGVNITIAGTTNIIGNFSFVTSTVGVKTFTGDVVINNGAIDFAVPEDLIMNSNLIMNGNSSIGKTSSANGIISVSNNFNTSPGSVDTIGQGDFTISGTTTVDSILFFNNNTGVKTFAGNVILNNTAKWNSTAIWTNSNMIFQNGITNNGSQMNLWGSTFNINNQILYGSFNFAQMDINGISLTNNASFCGVGSVGIGLTGTGTLIQGTSSLFAYGGTSIALTGGIDATAAGNTFIYYGTSGNTIYDPLYSTYYNLELHGNGSILSNNTSVDGRLWLTNLGTPFLDVNNFDIYLKGDWINNSANADPLIEGAGTVFMIGTSFQVVQNFGNVNGTVFNNLSINNPTSVGLTLDITVGDSLSLVNGSLSFSGYNLTIGTGVSATGTIIVGSGKLLGGTLTRWFNPTSFTIGNSKGFFPMSTSFDTRPLWLALPSGLSSGGTVSVTHNATYPAGPIATSFFDASLGSTILATSNSSWIITTANGFASSGSNLSLRIGGTGFGMYFLPDNSLSLSSSTVGTHAASTSVNVPLEVNRASLSAANLNNAFFIGTRNTTTSPFTCAANVNGTITYSGGNINAGFVKLFSYTTGMHMPLIDSVGIVAGTYNFSNVIPGNYIVFAQPDSLTYPMVTPTYFDTAAHWQNAVIVTNVCSINNTANIVMNEFLPLTGSATITGQVVEGLGYVRAPGTPIQGTDVGLEHDPGGALVTNTTTNSSGVYTFTNIPPGCYKVYVNIPGLPMDSTYHFCVVGADTIINLNFIADSGSVYIDPPVLTQTKEIADMSFNLQVYPNPNSGQSIITFDLKEIADVQLNVYSLLGEKIASLINERKQAGTYHQQFNANALGLNAGVYLLKLKIGNEIITKKIIQTR